MKEEAEQLVMDYKDIFLSPQGARVLEDLSKFCHEKISGHTPGDPYSTAFRVGCQRVMLYIRQKLDETFENFGEKKTIS